MALQGFLSNVGDVDDMSKNIINIFQDDKAFEEMKKNAIRAGKEI